MTAVPPTEKARATRGALVQSAAELFEASGYGAVSIRDLARRNDVTSGAIYGHFRNKADLLAAAIADRIDTDLEGPKFGRVGLTEYLARQARAYPSRAGLRALLAEGAHAGHVDNDARREIGDLHETKLAEWRAIYRTLQEEDDSFAGIDMDTLVTMLWAMELGLGVLEAAAVVLPKPTAWAATLRALLDGIE
jgi:AcrR family transcriptional regulator